MAQSLKISSEITGPKLDAKFDRMVKNVGDKVGRMLKASDMGKLNKEWEKLDKNIERSGKKMQGFTKIMQDQTVKAFRQQIQAVNDLGTAMENMTKRYHRQPGLGDRLIRMKARQYGMSASEYESAMPANAAAMRARANERAEANRDALGGRIGAGADELRRVAQQEEMDRLQERQQQWMKVIRTGQAVSSIGGIVSAGTDLVAGHYRRATGFAVDQASLAGRLYGDITSGNYGSLFALKQNAGLFQALHNQARQAAVGGTVGSATSKFGSALTQAGVGAAVPGAAASAAGGAATSAIGGVQDLTNLAAGGARAQQARAAVEALDIIKGLNPIQQMQFEALSGNLPMLSRMMQLGGTTDFGPYNAFSIGKTHNFKNNTNLNMFRNMMAQGELGGRTMEETMGLFQSMRGSTSHVAAMGLAGTAAQGERLFGMGAGATAQGLAGFARMGQGNDAATKALEDTMRKAMKLGIQDSQLKEAITAAIPDFTYSASGGRAANTAMLDQAMVAAQRNMSGRGASMMDMTDIGVGTATVQGLNRVTSGRSGLNALDVRKANMIYSIPGLSAGAKLALSQMNMSDLNSDAFNRIAAEEKMNPDALRATIMQKYKGLLAPSQLGFGSASADFLTGQVMGIGADAARGMRLGLAGGAAPSVSSFDSMRAPLSADEESMARAQQANARNQNMRVSQALSDPNMIKNLEAVTTAGGVIADMLANVAKNDPSKLRELDKIIEGVTGALYNFQEAMISVSYSMGIPVVTGK